VRRGHAGGFAERADVARHVFDVSGSIRRADRVSAHTPGPWRVKGSGRGLILRIFSGDHDDLDTEIATVFRSYCVDYDYEANARLMAAAPELLAALKRYLDNHCANADAEGVGALCECRFCLDTRAAIAKAEGGRSRDNAAPVQPERVV
jgi:hypothetical protein